MAKQIYTRNRATESASTRAAYRCSAPTYRKATWFLSGIVQRAPSFGINLVDVTHAASKQRRHSFLVECLGSLDQWRLLLWTELVIELLRHPTIQHRGTLQDQR